MGNRVKCVALFTHQVADVSAEMLAVALPILLENGVRLLLPPGEALKHPDLRRTCSDGCREVG
ncbi:MAG TPA: hypothetical protein VFD74_01500, partial [Thermoleophilia bacterium]|nr:hypothetical protein [Thermoleophilia bacterium]